MDESYWKVDFILFYLLERIYLILKHQQNKDTLYEITKKTEGNFKNIV